MAADRVSHGQQAPAVSRIPSTGLGSSAHRQGEESDDRPARILKFRRREDEGAETGSDSHQALPVNRQAEDKETIQEKPLQLQDEKDEPVRENTYQNETDEDESKGEDNES